MRTRYTVRYATAVTRDATATAPGDAGLLAYCEHLLRPAAIRQLCQTAAERIAEIMACQWSAVFYVDGQARGFDLCGSVGAVPPPLHDGRFSTPLEVARALGWSAESARTMAVAAQSAATDLRNLCPPHARSAYTILGRADDIQGVVVCGRTPPLSFSAEDLLRFERDAIAAGAALRYAAQIADLRIADQTKSEFVATMSHELRNPLSAILGYTDLLVQGDFGPLTQEQGEILRRAHQSAKALHDLINATLDVSRFEVGDRAERNERVDVVSLFAEQIRAASERGDPRRLQMSPVSAASVIIATDARKLAVALRQVVDAAAAACDNASLSVEIRAVAAGCTMELAPSGVALTRPDTPVLIDWLHDDAQSAVPFALLVARRLLELLGGTLSVWRLDGGELAIRVWLPESQS